MGNTLIVLGNGFSRAISDELNFNALDVSNPFTIFENIPDSINKTKFKTYLKELFEINEEKPFEKIKKYSDKYGFSSPEHCHLRRFLAYVYSFYQIEVRKYYNLHKNLDIQSWFERNKESINTIYTFNYDLLLEDLLQRINTNFYRVGCLSEIDGIPILKHHGSIDFDIPTNIINTDDFFKIITYLNDCDGIEIIKEKDLLEVRRQADIIPPNDENFQRSLSWNKKGYETLKRNIHKINKVIIFGFSYSPADRNEFKEIMDLIPKHKKIKIYDINISHSISLEIMIKSRAHRYIKVKSINLVNGKIK